MSDLGKIFLPPPDAEIFVTACDYCSVGCGYKVYRWPVGVEGGPLAADNAYAKNFPTEPLSGYWAGPNSYSTVMVQGEPHHLLVIADGAAQAVNLGGDHSIRGGAIAQKIHNPKRPTHDRLKTPMIRVSDRLTPVSWDLAIDVAAALSTYVIENHGESAWAQKMFTYHYFENSYALTKLSLRMINTPAWAPHNRPSAEESAAGFTDTGYMEFAPSFYDWGNADTLFVSGTDPFETKTVLFNQWIMPAIDAGMKAIFVLPRKTTGAAYAESNGGLFLQIIPGTDTALHMAICRIIIEQGWSDTEFIKTRVATSDESDLCLGSGDNDNARQARLRTEKSLAHGFDDYRNWLLAQPESELTTASRLTGIDPQKIIRAAEMMARPTNGKRPKTSMGFEKGLCWSNNYQNTASFAALAVMVGAGDRQGRVAGRFGGHQRGEIFGGDYPLHKSPEKTAKGAATPINLDKWLINGKIRFAHVVGTTWNSASPCSTALREKFVELTRRSAHQIKSLDREKIINTLKARVDEGGMVVVHQDIYLRDPMGLHHADIILPASTWGESDFSRCNGERRLRFYSKFCDAPGQAKPDWEIAAMWAKKMGFPGFDWKHANDLFEEAARASRGTDLDYEPMIDMARKTGMWGHELLRKYGTTGIQLPLLSTPADWTEETRPGHSFSGDSRVQIEHEGTRYAATVRLHDAKRKLPDTGPSGAGTYFGALTSFNTPSGKLNLIKTDWNQWADFYDRWQPTGEQLWVINGRINEVWQSGFDDVERRPYITERWPENWIELHPDDAKERHVESGDLVRIWNEKVPLQTGSASDSYSSLLSQNLVKFVRGEFTAVVVVTPAVRAGVAWTYFLRPDQPANAITPMIVDPISNQYRYKLGIGELKKIGESPYKHKLRQMSFGRRDLT